MFLIYHNEDLFYILVCENEAGTVTRKRTTCVPIEVELTSCDTIVVTPAAVEPRVRGRHEVRIVCVMRENRATEKIFATHNLYHYDNTEIDIYLLFSTKFALFRQKKKQDKMTRFKHFST